jgi:iron complex transport system substrate-binding protein
VCPATRPEVRREKPRVSAFKSADIAKIEALAPDLVLAFSDIQATIAADLARAVERHRSDSRN